MVTGFISSGVQGCNYGCMVKYWSTQKLMTALGAALFHDFFTFPPSIVSPPKPFHNFSVLSFVRVGSCCTAGCVRCPVLLFLPLFSLQIDVLSSWKSTGKKWGKRDTWWRTAERGTGCRKSLATSGSECKSLPFLLKAARS